MAWCARWRCWARTWRALGHTVRYDHAAGPAHLSLPTYPEIRLAFFQRAALTREIREFAPDAVHIATEGSAGPDGAAHLPQARHRLHHRLPHPLRRICPCPLSAWCRKSVVWRWLRWFHHPATAVMVATQTLKRELAAHGFKHLRIWSRGVDVEKFHPIAGRAPAL